MSLNSSKTIVRAYIEFIESLDDTLYAGIPYNDFPYAGILSYGFYKYSETPMQAKPKAHALAFSGDFSYNILGSKLIIEYALQTSSSPIDITLFNLQGKQIMKIQKIHNKIGNNTAMLNLDGIRPGCYSLCIRQNSIQKTTKILKVR